MKIAIDVSPLLTPMTGIGYYWKSKLEKMFELLKSEEKIILYAFYWNDFPNRSIEIRKKFSDFFIEKKIPERFLEIIVSKFSPCNFDKLLGRPDAVNFTSLKFPETNAKKIFTLYDISFIENNEFHTISERKKHISAYNKIINSKEHIVTISEFSKKRIIEISKIPANRISAIYPALPEEISKHILKSDSEVFKKFTIRKPFILFNGTIEPRKNITNLVNAYILSKAYKDGVQLVISGKFGWHCEKIFNGFSEYDKSLILFTDYIKRDELFDLYNSALMFIYPSLYEGFGLPVIEAMSFGCPVITSGIEVIREAAGDSAVFVNPKKISEITDAINTLFEDSSMRKKYSDAGFLRAEKYMGTTQAQKLLELYRSIAKGAS